MLANKRLQQPVHAKSVAEAAAQQFVGKYQYSHTVTAVLRGMPARIEWHGAAEDTAYGSDANTCAGSLRPARIRPRGSGGSRCTVHPALFLRSSPV